MNNIISSALKTLGLSDFDSMLYETLLTNPNPTVSLLSKKLRVSRTKIYTSLNRLLEYELVSFKLDFSGEIQIASPAKISTLLKFQNSANENTETQFNTYLPHILDNYRSTAKNQTIKVYEGVRDFTNLINLVLDEIDDELFFIGNMDGFYNLLGWDYLDQFGAFRRKKNVYLKMLVFKTNGTLRFQLKDNKELRETRFLPEKYLNQGVVWFYKDTVISWNLVLNKAIYNRDIVLFEFYKQLFEMSWET